MVDLSDQHAAGGATSRPSRRVDPPRRVLVHIDNKWRTGSLDMWIREPSEWYGRATLDDNGTTNWYPARALRPSARG